MVTLNVFRVRYDPGDDPRSYKYIEIAALNPTEALRLGLMAIPDGGKFTSLETTTSTVVVAA